LVPFLMISGLVATWCGLGALALALTALGWRGWPDLAPGIAAAAEADATAPPAGRRIGLALLALLIGYGLDAVGVVPHMVFLSDFVARELHRGIAAGAHVWVLFGVGAAIGPAFAGHLGDRIGFGWGLRVAFLVQGICVALVVITADEMVIAVSSVVIGAFVPGIAPLALGRVHELLADGAGRRAAWRRATVAFAVGQAVGAYGFSYLLEEGMRYPTLFTVAVGALALALAVDLALSAAAPRALGVRS
ncbi:MAG TPA: YbfB/YjiJ family MFS transporter, partial [Alphaproteobacteria bacterium]